MILMLITNDVDIARHAVAAGVDRIFVDLETIGKGERQGHLDTHRASHTVDDVYRMRDGLPDADLLVRVNPLYEDSPGEIDAVLQGDVDSVMLPMFTAGEEVEAFLDLVDGRAKTTLLLETPQALARLDEVLTHHERIDELHVGLNDLHLGLGLDFLFEPLAGGLLDFVAERTRAAGVRFGFGGVARVGDGEVPAEVVIGEHVRLGSEMVILSRAFHECAADVAELRARLDLAAEVARLRACVEHFRKAGPAALEDNRLRLREALRGIARHRRGQLSAVAS